MSSTAVRPVAAFLVAVSTAVVIVAAALALFFNPLWVAFEQDRTNVPALIGYTPDEVRSATNAILGEIFVGPGTFTVEVDGEPVLNERERGHMADVRSVVLVFGGLTLGAAALLVAASRARAPRDWLWRSVAAGAGLLAGTMVVVGLFAALFFAAAFELFHRLLFPSGSYTFDPARDRLVQLFPMSFWAETAMALAVVMLVLAVGVTVFALRRVGPEREMANVARTAPVGGT